MGRTECKRGVEPSHLRVLVRDKNNRQKFNAYFANKWGDLSVDKEKGVLGLLKQNVIIEEVFFARRIWSIIR